MLLHFHDEKYNTIISILVQELFHLGVFRDGCKINSFQIENKGEKEINLSFGCRVYFCFVWDFCCCCFYF